MTQLSRLLCALVLTVPAVAQEGVALERAFPFLRFERPVELTHAGDGSERVFVVEQDGVIRVFPNDAEARTSRVFLDLRERISRRGNEEGLLGLAFAPDYRTSGRFYVHYSSSVKDEVGIVARFHVDPDDPNRALPDSESVVLEQPQPFRNHNGGTVTFDLDGMLLISFGDGGHANDPQANGQNLNTWLGAVLRVDVSGEEGYSVPADNPFVGREDARPEIWAYGLRNVWRLAVDRSTGRVWGADVGQNLWEEVNELRAGGNYGWNTFEANHPFEGGVELNGTEHALPVVEYPRSDGISITGGHVYRGERFPELDGLYVYGDYATGNLWGFDTDFGERGTAEARLLARTGRSIASFGADEAGEVYLCSFDGGIYRVLPGEAPGAALASWPKQLSETELFTSLSEHRFADGVAAYEVNVPFWSDGATKSRGMQLPKGKSLGYRADGAFDVPVGTTLIKSFQHPRGGKERWLETRLIKRTAQGWEAGTYLWNGRQTDAELIPEGRQIELWNRSGVDTWHAPSSAECAQCHVADAGYVLGLTGDQLDHDGQLEGWLESGLLTMLADQPMESGSGYAALDDEDAPLEQRVRTWLDVNCAMCHFPKGPGNAAFDVRFDIPLAETGLLFGDATQGDLGIEGAQIVLPGDPARSLLLHRIKTLGDGRMPNLASHEVDQVGVALLEEWIAGLSAVDVGWVDLFDGETLEGWTQRNGTATYRVEDGAIVGKTADGSPNSFLCTDRGYDDFELRFEVKVHDQLNSGVQIRSTTRDGFTGRVNGPQVEIESSGAKGAEAGYLYGEAAGGWMTPREKLIPHKHFRDGEWNDYRVLAVGPRIQVWINGEEISDLVDEGKYASHPRGFIGLQVHGIGQGQGPFEVAWRGLQIREIKDASGDWDQLFNGKDLTGWLPTEGNWFAERGDLVIDPREGESGWQRFGAYLISERKYGDFVFDLEYQYPKGGNSGVFFRIADPANPVHGGIEAQILDCFGKEGEMTHHDHGGIIQTVGASENRSAAPGEWNRMVIVARGSRLIVELNGAQIIDVDLKGTPMEIRPLTGHLGLQDHGRPHTLSFRNVWVKELK